MFGLLKQRMGYEDFGYLYAESMFKPFLDGLVKSHPDWLGRRFSDQDLGRQLAIFGMAGFQLCMLENIRGDDAQGHVVGGVLRRLTEDYDNFAFDPTVHSVLNGYMRALGTDLRSPQKGERFPGLVSLALGSIANIRRGDLHWRPASDALYLFMENVQEGLRGALRRTTAKYKLVVA